MTYVVGLNQLGANAIICDTRVTWWRSTTKVGGANTSLKSGLLFPGCIYGIVGDLGAARDFIIEGKRYLTGTNTLAGFWEKFTGFVKQYAFQPTIDGSFQLLLSSRNLGSPRFYVLNSTEATLEAQGKLVTLGSGKEILDASIDRLISDRSTMIDELIEQNKIPPFSFPYFYCLWLNEMTQGTELSRLEEYDVGGIFHFLWQDWQHEHAQFPAVYALSAADVRRKTICTWICRVVYAEGALVVDNPITNAREIFIDTAARPSFAVADFDDVRRSISSEVDSAPFYYFCGFGFSDPGHRGEFGFSITTENKFVVTKDGWIDPKYRALIEDKFSRDYCLKLENEREVA